LQQNRGIGVSPMIKAPSWPGRPCHFFGQDAHGPLVAQNGVAPLEILLSKILADIAVLAYNLLRCPFTPDFP